MDSHISESREMRNRRSSGDEVPKITNLHGSATGHIDESTTFQTHTRIQNVSVGIRISSQTSLKL